MHSNQLERPILFSTDMVKSLLARTKRETRRTTGLDQINQRPSDWYFMDILPTEDGKGSKASFFHHQSGEIIYINCPYGKDCDLLWVRESYCPGYFDDGSHGYKADWNDKAAELVTEPKWKPSIHMPRAASRITLEIENIYCQRLRDISDESAIAEGIGRISKETETHYIDYLHKGLTWRIPKHSFFSLWEKINGKESLAGNPWMWVVVFNIKEAPGIRSGEITHLKIAR